MNPLFKQQVEALFEKLAVGHNPTQVAADLRAAGRRALPAEIARGQGIIDVAAGIGRGTARAADVGSRVAKRVMAPLSHEGPALFRELGAAGAHATSAKNLPVVAGALALAPILASSFGAHHQRREDELMNLQMSPMFTKMNHLDLFLEKKAAVRAKLPDRSFGSIPGSVGGHTFDSFTSGVGQGVGGGVAKAILSVLGGGIGSLHNSLIVDPKRQRLFESIVRTDPVVQDAVSRTPHAMQTLTEAFQTMVRFAPSLSLDVNAVRSFLREAVVGGAAGVNYATIKTLIDTEKGLHGSGDRK